MRFLLRATIPTEAGNKMVRDPNFGSMVQEILSEIKAEASYFVEDNGHRTVYVVLQIQDPSEIPNVAEPFFQGMNATVELMPAMIPEDLAKAGPAIDKWNKRFS